jgi:hypothetical protein
MRPTLAHFSLNPGNKWHPLPLTLTSLSVTATNDTPHHHRRCPPTDTAQNPATSSTKHHPRVPIDNAHQIRLRATHRPPPTSTINTGHRVLHSDDPSPDPTTKQPVESSILTASQTKPQKKRQQKLCHPDPLLRLPSLRLSSRSP